MSTLTKAATFLALAALAGCATPDKAYESQGEKNLHINAKTIGGSFAMKTGTFLYVYEVTPQCKLDYLGHVLIDKPALEVGLPTGKPLVLRAEFAKGGRFDSSGVRNSYAYFVQLRPGYDYAAEILHQEQFHKFALSEGRRGGPMRAVERKSLETCVPK